MNESEQSMTCRKAVQPTSKPDSVVDPGQAQTKPVYGLSGVRRRGCMNLIQAFVWNVGTCWFNLNIKVIQRGGAIRSSDEAAVMAVERRDCGI